MSDSGKPELLRYFNIHHFLNDFYTYRKKTERGFSYEVWSAELNLNNRSFLRQLICGKRNFTPATIDLFKKRLFLDPVEKEYFHLLILYSLAKTQTERQLYSDKLRQMLKWSYDEEPVSNHQTLVSNTLLPRMLTYLTHSDTDRSLAGVAKFFALDTKSTLQYLEDLKTMNLIYETEGMWSASGTIYKVPESLGDNAMLKYHQQSLLDAIAATQLPINERRFRSLLVSLSPEQFDDFCKDLNLFAKETLSKYQSDILSSKKIYQINLNIHSV